MKKILILFLVFASIFCSNVYAIDKEELKKSVDELSPEEIKDINDKLGEKMLKTAEDTGFILGSVMGGGGGFYVFFPNSINKNKLAEVDNISCLYGGAGGFFVNASKNWGWGVQFGGMGGSSSKKVGSKYYSYTVGGTFAIPYLEYKVAIEPRFIFDVNLGLGFMWGGFTNEIVDETAPSITNVTRSGVTYPFLFDLECRYRINPVWHAGVKFGYLSASISELKRADFVDNSLQPLDFTGTYLAVSMGGNF